MLRRPLSEGKARPPRAPPPLAESRHRRIVPSYLGVKPPDASTVSPQAHAEFGFLSGNQRRVEALDRQ